MDDLVERLRGFVSAWLAIRSNCEHIHGINDIVLTTADVTEAADRIEALQAQLEARDAEIAAWLRAGAFFCNQVGPANSAMFARLATAIEAGEYRKDRDHG